MTLQQLEGRWTFSRPATAGVERLPASAKIREGMLEIAVPRLGSGGLVIRAVLQGEEMLAGRFELGASSGTVDLRVKAEGRRLVGHPTAFANRERWQFSRD